MHKTATAYLSPAGTSKLTGGADPATTHFRIDFTAAGIDSLRQAWLTLAPALNYDSTDGTPALAAYSSREWQAVFANWTVADPGGVTPLKVAGPGSVVVDNRDRWTSHTGCYSGWPRRPSSTK